jgi:hypothetical protein
LAAPPTPGGFRTYRLFDSYVGITGVAVSSFGFGCLSFG